MRVQPVARKSKPVHPADTAARGSHEATELQSHDSGAHTTARRRRRAEGSGSGRDAAASDAADRDGSVHATTLSDASTTSNKSASPANAKRDTTGVGGVGAAAKQPVAMTQRGVEGAVVCGAGASAGAGAATAAASRTAVVPGVEHVLAGSSRVDADQHYSAPGPDDARVVIDMGANLKVGLAGALRPASVTHAAIGVPRHRPSMVDMGVATFKDEYVGGEAEDKRGIVRFRPATDRGQVVNWDDMEKLWHHAFYSQLKQDPHDAWLFVSQPPQTTKQAAEKTMEIAFETFNVRGVCIHQQAPLCLYASGRTTGVVLDCGETVTHAVPVWDGYTQHHATQRLELGGVDVTKRLMRMMLVEGAGCREVTTPAARAAKEHMCYVARDPAVEAATCGVKSFTMPDGNEFTTSAAWQAPEVLFDPALAGVQSPGIPQLVADAVDGCFEDMRGAMSANVLLAGGSATCAGFRNRVASELAAKEAASGYRVAEDKHRVHFANSAASYAALHHVYEVTEHHASSADAGRGRLVSDLSSLCGVREDPTRAYSAWQGGSAIAAMPARNMWVTRQAYDAMGVGVVHTNTPGW